MAPALAVSAPVASSPSVAVFASAGANRSSCCAIPVPSSSSRSLRSQSQTLRAATGVPGNRLGGVGRRAFVVRAVQGQDATIPVPDVTKSTWQSLVIESELPVLVEFTASWCGPCRMIDPIISKISKDFEGKLKCYKLDTDESPEIASQYGVRSVPTMMLFKGGEKKDAIIGAVPEGTLVTSIEKFI